MVDTTLTAVEAYNDMNPTQDTLLDDEEKTTDAHNAHVQSHDG